MIDRTSFCPRTLPLRRRTQVWLYLLAALVVAATVAGPAQTNAPLGQADGLKIGLYKDGRLVDTLADFSPVSPTQAAMSRALARSSSVSSNKPLLTLASPSVAAETQARNGAFSRMAESAAIIQTILEGLAASTQADTTEDRAKLAMALQQFLESAVTARAALDQTGQRVAELNLDPAIAARHAQTIAAFDQNLSRFTDLIHDAVYGRPGAFAVAIEFIEKAQFVKRPSLEKVSPTIQVHIEEAPRLTREAADALLQEQRAEINRAGGDLSSPASASGQAGAASSPPTPADLAPTIDVQITPEITQKANDLGNSPLAIYEFVRNNIAFQPYLGSRKGSVETLHQRAGNDTDQASLLLALLRAANIPSRYVRGTVEMTPEQAKSWLGVDDARTAGSILTTAGLDGLNIIDGGGNTIAIRCTRVWVEAFVPYSNYRGVPNEDTGKTWIPMDSAFKGTIITSVEDILPAMSLNITNFLAQYVAQPALTNFSPIEHLDQTIQTWLDANRPGMKVADFERSITSQALALGLLPGSLPHNLLTLSSRFSELEDSKRFKVRFRLYNGGTTYIDYTANLSQLAGHRVHISYVGATSSDQTTIDAHGGIFFTPPNLVNVKAVLTIDDVPVAVSVNAIGMGRTHNSDMHFIQPVGDDNVQPVVSNTIIAGNSQAIAFDTFLDSHDPLLGGASAGSTNYFHETLYSSAVDYLRTVDRGMEKAQGIMQIVTVQDVSEAIVESSVSVTYSFGVPQTFEWTGFIVDADRRIIGPFAANGDQSKKVPYMLLTGYEGSAMEHRVFEGSFGTPAVSTIRAFHMSVNQGIPLCYITNSIASACPGFSHSSSVLDAVNTALSQGHIVIIPRQAITYGQWSGTGYIDLDPATGAAGYIIAGGINGNVTAAGGAIVDWFWPLLPPCLTWPWNVSYEFISPPEGTVYCADDTYITFEARVTATSCLIGSPSYTTTRTGHRTKRWIADHYGGGDYVLVMDSLFSAPVTRKIIIVNIRSLNVTGATVEAGKTDHHVTAHGGGNVVITAVLEAGSASGSLPAGLITWTGGTAGSSPLERRVSKSSSQNTTVTANCASNEKSCIVHVVDADPPGANAAARLNNTTGAAVPSGSFSPFGVMWGHRPECGDPTPVFSAYLDGNHWVLRLASVGHVSRTGIQSGGNTDITSATDADINIGNFQAVITDLTPPAAGAGQGPPRTTYWCSDITQSHENRHVSTFHNTYWTPRMTALETWVEGDAANVLYFDCGDANTTSKSVVQQSRQTAIQDQANVEHDTAWDNYRNAGWDEVGTHNYSNPLHTARITAIQTIWGHPTVAVNGPGSVAVNASATFTSTVNPIGGNYSWNGGETPPAGSGASFTTKWSSAGNKTVTLTYTIPGGSPGTATTSINVTVSP